VVPAEAFAMMVLFISGGGVLVLRGPLGKALAERISGRAAREDAGPTQEIQQLQSELEDVKQRLGEAEERLDFTERLLAQQRQQSSLHPGS
jgi:hypothetical protein